MTNSEYILSLKTDELAKFLDFILDNEPHIDDFEAEFCDGCDDMLCYELAIGRCKFQDTYDNIIWWWLDEEFKERQEENIRIWQQEK